MALRHRHGEHGTVLGVGGPLSTPRHDPPARLAHLVRTIHSTCVFPGCSVPARRCDLDHRHPHERGGPTCSCNLIPLCRAHHRLKGTGCITVRPATSTDLRATDTYGAAGPDTSSGERRHGEPSGSDNRYDGSDGRHDELDAYLRDLDRTHPEPQLPAGSLVWQLRSGKTYLRVPEPATPAPLTPSMHDIPAHLDTQRHAEAVELRRLNADLADAIRRDREHRAATERQAQHATLQAALHDERMWAPPDDQDDRPDAAGAIPTVPADLAQLWASAPLAAEPDLR